MRKKKSSGKEDWHDSQEVFSQPNATDFIAKSKCTLREEICYTNYKIFGTILWACICVCVCVCIYIYIYIYIYISKGKFFWFPSKT